MGRWRRCVCCCMWVSVFGKTPGPGGAAQPMRHPHTRSNGRPPRVTQSQQSRTDGSPVGVSSRSDDDACSMYYNNCCTRLHPAVACSQNTPGQLHSAVAHTAMHAQVRQQLSLPSAPHAVNNGSLMCFVRAGGAPPSTRRPNYAAAASSAGGCCLAWPVAQLAEARKFINASTIK